MGGGGGEGEEEETCAASFLSWLVVVDADDLAVREVERGLKGERERERERGRE
jgi:hypothetical protein